MKQKKNKIPEGTNIKTSPIFKKVRKSKKRVQVHEGGSRSSKTYSIVQYLVFRGISGSLEITICRQKMTWCKNTVMRDFINIMTNDFKIYNKKWHNKSENYYTHFHPNGTFTRFTFMGLDDPQKAHGYAGDILYINEADEGIYNTYKQLAMRTRLQVILDYNPKHETHWIYDKVIPREDCDFFKSTYKDNPFLTKGIIREIEALKPTAFNKKMGTADETLWKIYGLGERAANKGLIFSNWNLVPKFPKKEHRRKYWITLDFGFTNDPTAIQEHCLSQGSLYHNQLTYERGLITVRNQNQPDYPSIQGELEKHKVDKRTPIYADSAEPKAIAELQLAGYNIIATYKGPDSIKFGIELLKTYNNYLTDNSVDAIKEKNNYKWKYDEKTDRYLNEPVDAFNHFFDGTRYGAVMELPHSRVKKRQARYQDDIKAELTTPAERLRLYKKKRKAKSRNFD